MSVRLAAVLAFVGVFAAAAPTHAQVDEAGARQQFRLGQAHYENGQFEQAAAAFEEAYRLSGRARLLYNAYLAHRDLQDLPNAARTLRQFLTEVTALDATERDQLQARLAAIDAAIARMQSSVPSEPPRQAEPQAQAGSGSGSDSPSPEPQAASGGGFSPSPVGFVVGGAGVALGVAAIVTGVMASADYSTLSAECPQGNCPDRDALREAQSRGATLAILTDVFWPTAVVAVAVGVTLIFLLQDGGAAEASDTTGALGCTQDGCYGSVSTRF